MIITKIVSFLLIINCDKGVIVLNRTFFGIDSIFHPVRYLISVCFHRLHRCWWRMLETKCVGDKFEMLVTDLIHWENHKHNETSHHHNDYATNIWNQSIALSHQNNDVTNITVTKNVSQKVGGTVRTVRTVRWSLPWLRVLNKFSPYMAHNIYEFVVQYFKIL